MRRVFLLFGCSTLLFSCLKKKDLPDAPRLISSKFEINQSGAVMYLNFTDGDGNFGLEDADTAGIFAPCIRHWNLYAEYYELRNGVWFHDIIDPCDDGPTDQDVAFYYVIPWAKPTGQDQTQEGEIKLKMSDWYLNPSNEFDTIKFLVHIVDRSMNESNTLELGPFIKP